MRPVPPASKRAAAEAALVRGLFDAALASFGPRHWWPAETDEEVVIGAVLTQNTAWKNVEMALANMRRAGKLSLGAIDRMRVGTLAALIRPAGYFNLKARRLKSVARFLVERSGGNLASLRGEDPLALRNDLLQVHGVGPETADSILLYALGMPVFVVDAYTRRVLSRHGLMDAKAGYEDLRSFFEGRLAPDAPFYNEYHALLVAIGNRHCRPNPDCGRCPLFRRELFATARRWREADRRAREGNP